VFDSRLRGEDSELLELDDCWELDFEPDLEADLERDWLFDSLEDELEDDSDEDEVDLELEADSLDEELEWEHSSLWQISLDFGAWHSWSFTMNSW
jgi:hypothetical protein